MKYTLLFISLLLCSCSLFKKTSKTKDVTAQSSGSQLKYDQLVLKHADKETQIFTYWTDTGIYQFQHIKEQRSQSKSDQVVTSKQDAVKHAVIHKNEASVFAWILVVVAIIFGLWILWHNK